ncbi:MAG: hypothetical protein P4L40_03845 [Terracidiphilus sp.]|nr:hypothetical protein [Terracidiphilus sp.]
MAVSVAVWLRVLSVYVVHPTVAARACVCMHVCMYVCVCVCVCSGTARSIGTRL